MTLKAETLLELLRSLEAYVSQLERLRPESVDAWKDSVENYWAVLHGLQIAVQHVLDIATHILSAQNLAAPADYKEALFELGRNQIVPAAFAEKIIGMVGFRNLVVHRYLGLDPDKVFQLVHDDLNDFRQFSSYIYDYLRREGVLS